MASGPITSWHIDGETVTVFILGGSKITADGDCSHEIQRDSWESSPAPQFKRINSVVLSFRYGPTPHPYITTGKTIALTRQTFVG